MPKASHVTMNAAIEAIFPASAPPKSWTDLLGWWAMDASRSTTLLHATPSLGAKVRRPHGVSHTTPAAMSSTPITTAIRLASGMWNPTSVADLAQNPKATSATACTMPLATLVRPTPAPAWTTSMPSFCR